MEFETIIDLIQEKSRFHHKLYGYSAGGNHKEGIHMRIRQGVGGPTNLEVGADVIGHYHVGIRDTPNTGDEVEMESGSDRWLVRLERRSSTNCYKQDGEDEIGCQIDGKIVKKIK